MGVGVASTVDFEKGKHEGGFDYFNFKGSVCNRDNGW